MPSPPLPPCPPPPLRPLLKIFPRPIPPLQPNPVALMVPDVCTVTLLALLKLMTVPCTRPETSISSTRHICRVKDNDEFKLQSSGG
uniref:Uncharacterized protein n=1 Tax=Arundo donax TaxID=35708 RepID=A0A0A9DSL7_ARUDO